jgi:hypothetical protein
MLFATHDPEELPLARRAFVVPLRWAEGHTHDARLPRQLQELAGYVCNPPGFTGPLVSGSWALHLSPELGELDLSGLPLQCTSGWAALAGGLLLATANARPDVTVWATGAWNDAGGIRPVGHLEAKVGLAIEQAVYHFFVPETQVEEVERLVREQGSALQVGALAEGERDPRKALRQYRNALDFPPLPSDPQESRCTYFLRQPDEPYSRRYYRENLLPDIVRNLGSQWARENSVPGTHLVTIVSDNPELVAMAIEVVRPRTCLVLYTRDKLDKLKEARQLLDKGEVGCSLVPSECASLEELRAGIGAAGEVGPSLFLLNFPSLEELLAGMGPAIRTFATAVDPEELVLDLTPGNKEMSLALALEVAQAGNRLYYVRHQRQGRLVIPFSERLLVRGAGHHPMASEAHRGRR